MDLNERLIPTRVQDRLPESILLEVGVTALCGAEQVLRRHYYF